jgi:ClpP class serine protease
MIRESWYQAMKLGFADSVGTWDDARRTLGQMTGLGDNPETFKVKKRNKLLQFFEASSTSETSNVSAVLRDLFQTELSARVLCCCCRERFSSKQTRHVAAASTKQAREIVDMT